MNLRLLERPKNVPGRKQEVDQENWGNQEMEPGLPLRVAAE